MPQNVGAWSARTNVIRNRINFSTEYAYKINDPSAANGFIYKPGEALFSSLSYSQKGLGIYLGFLRVDNFSFRSDRTAALTQLNINLIPTLTKQHTYALASTIHSRRNLTDKLAGRHKWIIKLKKVRSWAENMEQMFL